MGFQSAISFLGKATILIDKTSCCFSPFDVISNHGLWLICFCTSFSHFSTLFILFVLELWTICCLVHLGNKKVLALPFSNFSKVD